MSVSSLQQFGNVSTVILYYTVIDENWKITRVKKKIHLPGFRDFSI